jgi:hypothetical protein
VQPFLFRGLVAVPVHATGFGETSSALVRRFLDTDALIALYAHLNQALDHTLPNDESAALLDRFLATSKKNGSKEFISRRWPKSNGPHGQIDGQFIHLSCRYRRSFYKYQNLFGRDLLGLTKYNPRIQLV